MAEPCKWGYSRPSARPMHGASRVSSREKGPPTRSLDWPPRSPLPHRLAVALVAALVLLLGALAVAPAAPATIIGPCTAEIAGQDATPQLTGALEEGIPVHRDGLVPVSMTSKRPITRMQVELEFAGLRWTVHDRETEGTRWASEVPVNDYGVYGMGLWKVVATSQGPGVDCEATALIAVQDDRELDPLATISGLAGLGLALFGLMGVLAVSARIGKERSAPLAGLLLGAMFGLGVGVLLQQFSIVYPTIGVVLLVVAAGALFGLAFSLFGLPLRTSDARNEMR
jgi:hypothetical protein